MSRALSQRDLRNVLWNKCFYGVIKKLAANEYKKLIQQRKQIEENVTFWNLIKGSIQ